MYISNFVKHCDTPSIILRQHYTAMKNEYADALCTIARVGLGISCISIVANLTVVRNKKESACLEGVVFARE